MPGLSGGQTVTNSNPGVASTGLTPSGTGAATPGLGGTGQSGSVANNNANGSFLGGSGGMGNAGMGTFTPVSGGNATSGLGGYTPGVTPGSSAPTNGLGGAITTPATSTAPAIDPGPALYGNGHQTAGEFAAQQAATFNANQLAAQKAWNGSAAGVPYTTNLASSNPYDQYVNNPVNAGNYLGTSTNPALNSPANLAAFNASGLQSQLANPSAGFAASQPQNPQYGQNQLTFLLNTLRQYGANGQNQFGNGFSPLITGQGGTQGGLAGAPQTAPSATGQGQQFDISALLQALASQNQGPASGSYGNLGGFTTPPQQSFSHFRPQPIPGDPNTQY